MKRLTLLLRYLAILPAIPFTALRTVLQFLVIRTAHIERWVGRNFYYPVVVWHRRTAGEPLWKPIDAMMLGINPPADYVAPPCNDPNCLNCRASAAVAVDPPGLAKLTCEICRVEIQIGDLAVTCLNCVSKAKEAA